MSVLWLATAALAGAPPAGGCAPQALPRPADTQAVAWISPLRRRVGRRASLRVVPVEALREANRSQGLSLGRLLQLVGERRRARPPKRAYKVTIFQASSGALCRPVADADPTDFYAGLPVCAGRRSRASRRQDGCGRTRDRAGGQGLPLYRGTWAALAPGGFCVLPAERFLAEL